jgi:ElaB/YqjD/DUF883 family membrane-anchored ribosome-binding protein
MDERANRSTSVFAVDEADDDTYMTDRVEIERTVTPPLAGASSDVDVARAQIEQTRAEMSGTIDAIKERLNPEHLVQQAKESVREATVGRAQEAVSQAMDTAKEAAETVGETAKGAGMTVVETVRQNPVVSAIVGIGLGWLALNGRTRADERRHWRYQPANASYGAYDPEFGTSYSGTDTSGGWHRDGTVDRARESLGKTVDQVQEKVEQLGAQVQEQTRQAGEGLRQALVENPLAVGAVCLALGAALGLAAPQTRPENAMMGETRDRLVDRAQQTAGEVVQKVQTVAQEALDTAREEAAHQGLTPKREPDPEI